VNEDKRGVIKRKVQRLGASSLIVTLPRDWARSRNLKVGDVVKLTLVNVNEIEHSLGYAPPGEERKTRPATDVATPRVQPDSQASIIFVANSPGEYVYLCTVPGHAKRGMYGQIIVEG